MRKIFWKLAVASSITGMALALPTLAAPKTDRPGAFAPGWQMKAEVKAVRSPSSTPKTVDLGCMQTTIGKREDAIMAAFTGFSTAKTAAFTKRKDALIAAWKMDNAKERRAAVRAAWNGFQTDSRIARNTFTTTRLTAWKQFHTDRVACGQKTNGEEQGLTAADAQI